MIEKLVSEGAKIGGLNYCYNYYIDTPPISSLPRNENEHHNSKFSKAIDLQNQEPSRSCRHQQLLDHLPPLQ